MNKSESFGRVILVPTPIGNLGDMTLRAIDVLREVDRIACEDTRHSARLLHHFGISGKPLIALHDHNEMRRAAELAKACMGGESIALISDAGMPGISDPGFRLVRACQEAGVTVEVLPGPSAVLTALVASGLPCHAFRFGGFLPIKSGKRRTVLCESLATNETSIFFESPHRIAKTLEVLAELAPDASTCVARELTKKFETIHRGSALELAEDFSKGTAKGEIVLLFHPMSAAGASPTAD